MKPGELIRRNEPEEGIENMQNPSYYIMLHPDSRHGAFVPLAGETGVGRLGRLEGVSKEDADEYEEGDEETKRAVVARYIVHSGNLLSIFKLLEGAYVQLGIERSDLEGGLVANSLNPGDELVELGPNHSAK